MKIYDGLWQLKNAISELKLSLVGLTEGGTVQKKKLVNLKTYQKNISKMKHRENMTGKII